MASGNIENGDQAAWQWSGSRPSGEPEEVTEKGDVTFESHGGNTIKASGDPGDPVAHASRDDNDAKMTGEPGADEKERSNGEKAGPDEHHDEPTKENADNHDLPKEDSLEKQEFTEGEKIADLETNGNSRVGEKHSHGEHEVENGSKDDQGDTRMKSEDDKEENEVEEDESSKEPAAKKQKTSLDDKGEKLDGEKKGRGRPKKSASQEGAAPVSKKEPRPALTADGKPRRSSRLQS